MRNHSRLAAFVAIIALLVALAAAPATSAAGDTGIPIKPLPCLATGGGVDWTTSHNADVSFNPNGPTLWCTFHTGDRKPAAVPGQYTGTDCVYGARNLGSWILTVYTGGHDAMLICGV